MSSSRRNDYITVESRQVVGTDPNYGTQITDWATFAEMFAEVQDVLPSRSEKIDDSISIARRPARVRVDYLDGQGVTSDMRVRIDGRDGIYQIIAGPAEKGVKQELEFMVESQTTQGDG